MNDRQAHPVERLAQQAHDHPVGAQCARRAAQDDGVAGFDAETCGVAGHVGAVLVDDADHPERDPHLGDPQAVGPDPAAHHLSDRVGQRRHRPQPGGHGPHPGLVEAEPVQPGRAHRLTLGGRQVGRVGRHQIVDMGVEQVGGGAQRSILHRRGCHRQAARRDRGALAQGDEIAVHALRVPPRPS
jgi:hypothetical protein